MSTDKSQVVAFTEEQVQTLVTAIFGSVNTRIADRIIQTITDDENHTPSVGAVKTYTDAQIRAKLEELFGVDGELSSDAISKSLADKLVGVLYEFGNGIKLEGNRVSIETYDEETNPDKSLPVSAKAIDNILASFNAILEGIEAQLAKV